VVLPVIDRLAAMAGAGRYTITADAESRGEVASSQAGTTAQWIAERCPSLDSREAVLAGLITMGGVDGAAGCAGCGRRCWPSTGWGRCCRRSRTGTPG
jgi:hypothetical protein